MDFLADQPYERCDEIRYAVAKIAQSHPRYSPKRRYIEGVLHKAKTRTCHLLDRHRGSIRSVCIISLELHFAVTSTIALPKYRYRRNANTAHLGKTSRGQLIPNPSPSIPTGRTNPRPLTNPITTTKEHQRETGPWDGAPFTGASSPRAHLESCAHSYP